MKLSVFGTGYVGLVAGVCFADAGNDVICVDIDENKIKKLQDGLVPIYEPGLDELLKSSIQAGRISFTTDKKKAIDSSGVIFIAVGTPENEDGSADLSHVLGVAKEIATQMKNEKVIVLKSTVPVGTAEKVTQLVKSITKLPFDVVSNPEFLKEGASIDDFLRPDRVVIGHSTENAKQVMGELYAPFTKNGNPILFMKNKAAELCKYAANSFLATKISFINELALLCDAVGADIEEVKKGFTSDSRINPAFFYPGVGYGGSCFPKDVKALIKSGEENKVNMAVIKATDLANDEQKTVLFKKIKSHFKNLNNITLGIWGLAFKPRTDDVREAPSFEIIDLLLKEGAKIKVYDPVAMENTKKRFGSKLEYSKNSYEAINGADALVLVTEWNEFKSLEFEKIKNLLKQKIIFDGRNVFSPSQIKKLGFTYYCIGREKA
ncbi:MAG: UDP-glucose/GDP-mannose dehydrogenase family protein [Oligoflexia bacterium]|nr:UDP-glucose/GDP-mannose dehydrogenase family protein [Oligoflexia bacterium]